MNETISFSIQNSTLTRIVLLAFMSFAISMILTPIFTRVAFKRKFWKRQRSEAWSGGAAKVYQKLHAAKHKRHIPTMAGLIFVTSVALVTLFFNLDRTETWLPLAAMVASGFIGLIDDFLNIRGSGAIAGMRSKLKFFLHSLVALGGGWWFFAKLDVSSVYIPGFEQVSLGIGIIALFWFIVIATANSVNISDGLDGLAGGLLTSSFAAYTVISMIEGQYALAGFCLAIVGALLSYTWFNIYPARFFMGDVGSFALGTALGVVALQTDTIYVLPVIGAVYVIETGSVIINRLSKRLRHGKKVFLSSPIHHHFEAIGWPETKVTMRFWILGQVAGVAGLIIFLVGRGV